MTLIYRQAYEHAASQAARRGSAPVRRGAHSTHGTRRKARRRIDVLSRAPDGLRTGAPV